MIIFVAGTGYVSKKAAEDLLMDFIVEGHDASDVTFVLPSYLTSDGLKNVKEAVDGINRLVWPDNADIEGTYWNLVRVKKPDMPDMFADDADDKIFMVLDSGSVPEMVKLADAYGLKVYDLSKGLWPVQSDPLLLRGSQHPLYDAESHGDGLTLPLGYDDTPQDSKPSEAISEPPGAVSVSSVFTPEQRREIGEIVQGIIAINRQNHPAVENRPEVVINGMETTVDELNKMLDEELAKQEEAVAAELYSTEGRTKYYRQSKTGKMRKAGKSKARPGEEETWLTSDQEQTL